MAIINANIAFDEQERADMAELVDINTQLKALEARIPISSLSLPLFFITISGLLAPTVNS